MSSSSLKEFTKAGWSEVYNRIIGAAVFIDDETAECLHWEGGLFNLMEAGAVCVKALSPFEYCPKDCRKVVFISQCTSVYLRMMQDIISHSELTHCILICCASLDVVYVEINEDRDVSDMIAAGKGQEECTALLEKLFYEWIGKSPSLVDIVSIPIFIIPITSTIFATPPFHGIYSSFDGKLTSQTLSDLYALSASERTRVRRLASGLNSLLESLNLKEDVYYMGSYSSLIAGVLDNSPVSLNRRKNCLQPATLIVIDRTVDLCGVTSYSSESVLDKIMAMLPRFPGHSNDVAVDMGPLCDAIAINHPDDIQLSPGCIYHATDEPCIQTFENMINKSQKEVMLDIYNKLSKIDVQKSPSPKNLLRVTPQSIEKIVYAVKGNYTIIEENLGLIQQALAMVQTLKSPLRPQIELMMSLEKQVLQSLAASRDSTSVLHQMCQLIRTRRDKGISLENLLVLIVHIYSLVGDEVSFPKLHEENLVETLGVALFEDNTTMIVEPGAVLTPENCREFANNLMGRLKEISTMRKDYKRYNSVIKPCETGVGDEYRGLLQQLVDDIVNTDRPELVDLAHRNDGIKDMFRSRFSMLTNKKPRTQKHPLDNQTVIIFVVGGVSAEECKRLHRTVITSGVDNTVLIGSTKLVTPYEAMRDVLAI